MTSPSGNVVQIVVTAKDQTGTGFDAAEAKSRKLAKAVDGGPGSAGAAMESASKKATGFGASLKRIGEVTAGVLVADQLQQMSQRAKALIDSTVKAASDLGESVNAVNKVFDESSAAVLAWGRDNANSVGLSQRAFNQMATPLGSMLKNQGLQLKDVTDHTIRLTERAADMASVFNTDVSQALTAIQAGLRGESDPLEQYGVGLSAAAVEARALADSGKTATRELTDQEKALARLNIIYDQTADTAGDFRDTSDGLANAQRIATATIEDAKAKIGTTFLPVMAEAAQLSGQFAEEMSKMPAPILITVAAVGGLAAGLLLLAPRIMATKAALAEMAASSNIATRGLSQVAVMAGKVGFAMAGLQVATQILHASIGEDLNPQIEALSDGLADWAKNGKVAGESARILGDDADKLDLALRNATSGGKGFSTWVESLLPGAADADRSWTKNIERVKALDTALATLVSNGRATEAGAAFGQIAARATELGIPIDDLKAAFPEYSAAAETAARKTGNVGDAAKGAAKGVGELREEYEQLFDDTFDLEEAQDSAADAVARLREQVKQQKEDHEKGAGSLVGHTQAARDNRDSVRDLVREYQDVATKMREAGKDTSGLKMKLEDQLVAMGFNRTEAQRYTSQLGLLTAALNAIPKVVPVRVSVAQDWSGVRKQDREYVPFIGPRAGNVNSATGFRGHAAGGIGGGWSMVGERGRELVKLPFGSSVIPNGTTENMLARSSGGGESRVIVDFSGAPEELKAWLRKTVRVEGGGNVQTAFGR